MTRIAALEHEVQRLRRLLAKREEKIERLYAKLVEFKTRRVVHERRGLLVREQGEYIRLLKGEIERLGGDWRTVAPTDRRIERRKKRTRRGNERRTEPG